MGMTVNCEEDDKDPSAAVIVDVPTPTVVARPWLPLELLIIATAEVPDVHVTELVMSCALLSEYVPVAVNCCFDVRETVGETGETEMLVSVAAVTLKVAVPVSAPKAAVMDAVPGASADASPCVPLLLLTVAIPVADELQPAELVRFCVLPSL